MKTLTFSQPHQNRLLIKCLALSLVAHVGALSIFYYNPLILQGTFKSLFGMSAATPTLLDTEDDAASLQKNHLLEEVFQQIIVMSPHFQQPYDLAQLPKGIALAPNQEHAAFEISSRMEKIDAPEKELALAVPAAIHEQDEERTIPSFFTPPETGAPIASQLQVDANPSIPEISMAAVPLAGPGIYEDLVSISEFSLNASFEADYALNLSPQLVSPNSLKIGDDLQLKTEVKPFSAEVTARDLNLENEQVRSTLFIPKMSGPVERKEVTVASSISNFEQYDFPALATAAEWNDDFETTVTFLPAPEGKGYIFSVSLKPNYDISSHSLKQNIYFILDRSNSVQKHRFAVFKRGVLKALSSMQHGDTFNIYVIDHKVAKFSSTNIPVSMKNIQAAEEFLDKQEGGGLFTAGEIYTSLEKILSSVPENDEVHTAILLTDGKSDFSAERKQKALKKWVELNHGKLSLYTAAIGRDNDLLSLDLLSSVSGGKLLYSDTHASFPRKLAKLILDLKDPVAKDLMISAVPHNPHSHIEFYPVNSHLPSLYSHQPYVIVGQIDEPCAFDLVIQGRHLDQWIAIKKNISFTDGHKGDHELTMQWTAQRANLCYAKFLKEGKASHLKEAKEILKKSRSEVAYE